MKPDEVTEDDAYLRAVLRMSTELRAVNSDDLTGQRERLIDRTVEMVTAFVEGCADRAAAAEVDRAWIEYTGYDPRFAVGHCYRGHHGPMRYLRPAGPGGAGSCGAHSPRSATVGPR